MKNIRKGRIGANIFLYVLSEILLYCFVAFLFFFVIFFVNNLLVNIQDNLIKNVSLPLIMEFFLYSVPVVIANAAPYSAFIGTLMCLGRFVGDSEFIALNALGISDRQILIPVMVAALILGLSNFFLNDFLIPYTAPKLNKIAEEMIRENPATQIQSYSIKKVNKIIIASGKVEKNTVNDLVIIDMTAANTVNILSAKTTQSATPSSSAILMALTPISPKLLMLNKNAPQTFDYAYGEKLTYNFLLSELDNRTLFSLSPGQLSSRDLAKKINTMNLKRIFKLVRIGISQKVFHSARCCVFYFPCVLVESKLEALQSRSRLCCRLAYFSLLLGDFNVRSATGSPAKL